MARCSKKLLRSENPIHTFNKEKYSWEKVQVNNTNQKLSRNLLDLGTHSTCKRMSQKVVPISFRTGFANLWDSLYFNSKKTINPTLRNSLHSDLLLKTYFKSILKNLHLYLSKFQMNRINNTLYIKLFLYEKEIISKRKVLINKSRNRLFKALALIKKEDQSNSVLTNPFFDYKKKSNASGWLINNKKLIDHLEERLSSFFKEKIKLAIYKENNIANSPVLFANFLAYELENSNISFKGALTRTFKEIKNTHNIKGIRINCSGRLGRAPMAKTEWFKYGQIPLNTMSAKLQYASSIAATKYGTLGIKVWIYYK